MAPGAAPASRWLGDPVSGDDEPLQVETAQCAVTVLTWRSGADWFDVVDRTLASLVDALELGGELDVARSMVAETSRQLSLSADLLEQAVQAAAAVGFELGATELPDMLVGAYRCADLVGRRPTRIACGRPR